MGWQPSRTNLGGGTRAPDDYYEREAEKERREKAREHEARVTPPRERDEDERHEAYDPSRGYAIDYSSYDHRPLQGRGPHWPKQTVAIDRRRHRTDVVLWGDPEDLREMLKVAMAKLNELTGVES